MASGECNCGAVSFRIECPITDVFICHCSICRRATGNNGNAVVVIDNEYFHWLTGEALISTWRKPNHDWQIWFCRDCGSQVPGENDENTTFIPAGCITQGGDELKIAHHIYVGSKACWDELPAVGRRHSDAFQGER